MRLKTYNDTEREYIGGLVNAALRMRLRTAPHPVAHLFTNDIGSRRYICCVFIGELDLLKNHSVMVLFPLDQGIIRLDICSASAIVQGPHVQEMPSLPV